MIGSRLSWLWRVLDEILSNLLVPVMNLVALFWILCSFMVCVFTMEFKGIIGYRRVDLMTVLYSLSFVPVDSLLNLAILLSLLWVIADRWATCGCMPRLFIARPRTLPDWLYWICWFSICIGFVLLRDIAKILNLLLLVCIFQFSSYLLICSIALFVSLAMNAGVRLAVMIWVVSSANDI